LDELDDVLDVLLVGLACDIEQARVACLDCPDLSVTLGETRLLAVRLAGIFLEPVGDQLRQRASVSARAAKRWRSEADDLIDDLEPLVHQDRMDLGQQLALDAINGRAEGDERADDLAHRQHLRHTPLGATDVSLGVLLGELKTGAEGGNSAGKRSMRRVQKI
jgi:hypothetical protein